LSIWDFFHPGIPDDGDVDVGTGLTQAGHLGAGGAHLGVGHELHGTTYQDPTGTFHHQNTSGHSAGSSWVDGAGTVHHQDQMGHEFGRTWTDMLGHAHHQNALGAEVAITSFDGGSHLEVAPAPGMASPGEASDPFQLLNDLLKRP
jgi:hypothetical protein